LIGVASLWQVFADGELVVVNARLPHRVLASRYLVGPQVCTQDVVERTADTPGILQYDSQQLAVESCLVHFVWYVPTHEYTDNHFWPYFLPFI
jgi:hypothetical protein